MRSLAWCLVLSQGSSVWAAIGIPFYPHNNWFRRMVLPRFFFFFFLRGGTWVSEKLLLPEVTPTLRGRRRTRTQFGLRVSLSCLLGSFRQTKWASGLELCPGGGCRRGAERGRGCLKHPSSEIPPSPCLSVRPGERQPQGLRGWWAVGRQQGEADEEGPSAGRGRMGRPGGEEEAGWGSMTEGAGWWRPRTTVRSRWEGD